MLRKLLPTAAIISCLVALPAQAKTNIMFIVDASGSMKEKVGDQTRMGAAKDVLGKTLENMPENANLGLLVYGHRTAKDCTDIELVSPIGGDDAAALKKTVSGLVAKGETPIAESIKQAAKSFSAFKGQDNKIILVTDGLEECKGDPCAAAKEAKASGLDVTVDVVGFTLGDEEAKAVQCITEATGGKYYGAADVDALTTALKEAATPEPVLTTAFEDDFAGSTLSENWEVINEDQNQYIVDDGKLMIIMPGQQIMPVSDEKFPNLFKALENMPSGDWTIEAVVKTEMHTARDKVYIGIMNDPQNWLAVGVEGKQKNGESMALAYIEKSEGGKQTLTTEPIVHVNGYMNFGGVVDQFNDQVGPIKVTLTKKGRDYSANFKYIHGEQEKTITLQDMKMLRPKSQLFIGVGQVENGGYGRDREALETTVNFDSIKVIKSEIPE